MNETIRANGRLALMGVACLSMLACSSGGASGGSGGASATGGATGSGGASATGSGGDSGTGGSTGSASGGSTGSGSGGGDGSGGVTGSGGDPATGGATGSGGRAATGSGGAGTGTGGGASTGGAAGGRGGAGTGTGGGAGTGTGGAGGASMGAKPSAGCGSMTAPTSGRMTIEVDGTMREYIITLPANYDPNHPYRLIFAFHGRMYDAQSVSEGGAPAMGGPYYGIQPQSGDSAIFVAPQALSTSWTNQSGRDVAYVNAMIAHFESDLCIDENRIFSVGFSMGAIMTLTLGCEANNPFRAIAPMSGQIPTACAATTPLAYWGSHGMSDPTINFSNGEAARDSYRTRNHCGATTTAGTPSGCVNYTGCDAGYPVAWCPFDGVHEPHPMAGTAIWAFLSQF